MQVGVGFSEIQDSEAAGRDAARQAVAMANRREPCDLVLLFATSWHDAHLAHAGVASVVGPDTPIIGGGAAGAIVNDRFGYGGDQLGLAAVWLEGVKCRVHVEGNLAGREKAAGMNLGRSLAAHGITRDTPALLLYDSINPGPGGARLNLATPLLRGMEKTLGFLPSGLVGVGMMGDMEMTPTPQWTGAGLAEQHAMLLTFAGGLEIDSVIMHGCRPVGGYYTVTKADGQTVLEVDGRPALPFIQSQLRPAVPVEEFPFFIIFGVNRGPDDQFREEFYANRLCLGIDKPRNGIVMFESDMTAGTRFQIMYRSMDLGYIPPRINHVFKNLNGRRPVFALYIDCAGRTAYQGAESEDALAVQRAVAGRAPLLGVYSGVEIAPIMRKPRTLDWTGVFCLFSVPA